MQHVIVTRIEPYSEGDECKTITLQSNDESIKAFSHMGSCKVADNIEHALSVLEAENRSAYLEDWPATLKSEHSIEFIQNTG